ncbi:MAG: AAA family ATPase [Candidatus Peribacteraceae bacterium]|nr:AAA family ATPase [Candidatus Peribacteraceae bacterium]
MRIISINIKDIRGIRQASFEVGGDNFAIAGPNGSGKSAVVDAIDFLLTGKIARLCGVGTRGISVKKHGPHIDAAESPEEVVVTAKIKLEAFDQPVEISRCMKEPDTLIASKDVIRAMEPVILFAQRGQHVLTRREILKYVHSESKKRAEEIQELLNISDIEEARQAIVSAKNKASAAHKSAVQSVEKCLTSIRTNAGLQKDDKEAILAEVNRHRKILGGEPITELHSTKIKSQLKGVEEEKKDNAKNPNPALLEKDIEGLNKLLGNEHTASLLKAETALRKALNDIRSNSELLRAHKHSSLISRGIELLDDSGKCPLCDTQWDAAKLQSHLERRSEEAKKAAGQVDTITSEAQKMKKHYSEAIAFIKNIRTAAQQLDLEKAKDAFDEWLKKLEKMVLLFEVDAAVEGYPVAQQSSEDVAGLFAPSSRAETMSEVLTEAKIRKTVSPQRTALDTLIRLEENLKMYETAKKDLMKFESALSKAEMLLSAFEQARDEVLASLYEAIRDRFVALYKELHGSDEENFLAVIEPSGAGLDFEVDFYGRGCHPPHALHSEGHQDSMGLCLFLALSDYLTKGILDLIILDDVVMSVDSEHRKQLCLLLKKQFPHRQFLITTHDRTWANQLKSEGVIKSSRLVEFYNWNVNSGPQVNTQTDLWERITSDLQKNDIPSAAHKLRRGAEEFFREVCDALQAKVTYHMNSRWDLGDFLPASISSYLSILAKAKESANSWNKQDAVDKIKEWESVVKEIMQRTRSEGWAVNSVVHFNEWHQLEKQDFEPVIEAYKELFDIFRCSNPKCGSLLKVINDKEGMPTSIKCDCGGYNMNLVKKSFFSV